MARDFLAIPASGVGVERLFNSARDVCHYRRGRLLPETIHAIMIQMCTDCFNLKQEYARIFDDITTEEEDWDLPADADRGFDDPMYISEDESEDEAHSIHENGVLNSRSVASRRRSTMSQAPTPRAQRERRGTPLASGHYRC